MVLQSGGMVAGFGPMFKTKITNASNTIMIVLYSYKVVAWWQFLRHSEKNLANAINIVMIVLHSYKVVAWWQGFMSFLKTNITNTCNIIMIVW